MCLSNGRALRALYVLATALAAFSVHAATGDEETLAHMSLQDLVNTEVTSVSKAVEPLSHAPAAIYVITHEEIVRSGISSVPEALRLAPNLTVRQLTSSSWAVSARGFAGNQGAQNFSNKLLVLIDGRSVYSPLYSGVYFDSQSVLLDDIDRIEVLSGPGATLWGANAMNGVINIITRPAYLTQGALAGIAAGNQGQEVEGRHGGHVSDETTYRVYSLGYRRDALQAPGGGGAQDPWWKVQGGFRVDYSDRSDGWTLQGDVYRASEDQADAAAEKLTGANILGRWKHQSARSDLQLQVYYDQVERSTSSTGSGFVLRTYDAEIEQTLTLRGFNRLTWGVGARVNDYDIHNTPSLLFAPPHRTLTLGNFFAQDRLNLLPSLSFIVGAKLEKDPYSSWAFQPDVRLSWAITGTSELWAAASRAIRSATPFDEDVNELLNSQLFLTGNRAFKPERVDAYQIGYRGQPAEWFMLSAALYYNRYDDLRSIDTGPPPTFLPLRWGNAIEGDIHGVETWADFQLMPWWRLSAGLGYMREELRFKPGGIQLVSITQTGVDPRLQGSITSSMDFGTWFSFDASIRHVGSLPSPGQGAPGLGGYNEISARLGWHLSGGYEISLAGQNLLHSRHQEYPGPDGEAIPRSGTLKLQRRF